MTPQDVVKLARTALDIALDEMERDFSEEGAQLTEDILKSYIDSLRNTNHG